jgi:invasion protein IalB
MAAYEFCLPGGCVARYPLLEDFLKMLKGGNTMDVTFAMRKQGEITATVSLQGFTKAFKSL